MTALMQVRLFVYITALVYCCLSSFKTEAAADLIICKIQLVT